MWGGKVVVDNIKIHNEGYVHCKSVFYSACDGLSKDTHYTFHTGINTMQGEIDSEIWAVSYLLSMYCHRPKDFILFQPPNVEVNGSSIAIEDFCKISCYLDQMYPLFSGKATVEHLIQKAIKINKLSFSSEEIRITFGLTSERFHRSVKQVGNEIFKAMVAIGYCYGKRVFCFPWMSQKRFNGYHNHLKWLLDTLEKMDVAVIIPIGR